MTNPIFLWKTSNIFINPNYYDSYDYHNYFESKDTISSNYGHTSVFFCILFTILIVNAELENYSIRISVRLLYCSYLVMKNMY